MTPAEMFLPSTFRNDIFSKTKNIVPKKKYPWMK